MVIGTSLHGGHFFLKKKFTITGKAATASGHIS